MTEKVTPANIVIVEYFCDECLNGKMIPQNIVLDVYPPKYPHICDNCGKEQALNHMYPVQKLITKERDNMKDPICSVLTSNNGETILGLHAMMGKYIGPNKLVQPFVPIDTALFISKIGRIAPDTEEYFPNGKVETLDAIDSRINEEIEKLARWAGMKIE